MSQQSVEIVRRVKRRSNESGASGFGEVWDEAFSPDAELRDMANAPDQADVLRGREAMEAALALWTAAFNDLRADIRE